MPKGEKHWGVPVVIGWKNLPSPVGIQLADLPNIGGPPGPPVPASLSLVNIYLAVPSLKQDDTHDMTRFCILSSLLI